MSDIKPLNRTTKTLAHVSYLSIDFQPLYALRGWPVVKVAGAALALTLECSSRRGEKDVTKTKYSTQTPKKSTLLSGQYLCNRSTLDIGVLGYIVIVWPKEHSPEVWSVPPVTPCICIYGLSNVEQSAEKASSNTKIFPCFVETKC